MKRHLTSIIEVQQTRLDMAVYTFNSSTEEAETGQALWVQGHPGLHIKFQTNHGYVIRPCLKNQNNKKDLANQIDKEEASV